MVREIYLYRIKDGFECQYQLFSTARVIIIPNGGYPTYCFDAFFPGKNNSQSNLSSVKETRKKQSKDVYEAKGIEYLKSNLEKIINQKIKFRKSF